MSGWRVRVLGAGGAARASSFATVRLVANQPEARARAGRPNQAQAYSPREGRTIRKTFASLSEARTWRQETQVALRRRTLRAPTRTTLSEAAEEWLAAARAGVVRTRSGEPYKPSG